MKLTTSVKRNSRSNGSSSSKRASRGFVICVKNGDYAASLELRKIYVELRDPAAAKRGLVRVVDETGEDYLYPQNCFMRIRLSETVQRALSRTS
jgi:hypothetical protein